MRAEYNDKYSKTKKEYEDLVLANKRNGYIRYYIDETSQQIESVQEYQDEMLQIMQTKLKEVYEKIGSAKNSTVDEYLSILIGELEMSLSDISDMITEQQNTFLRSLILGYLFDFTVRTFVKSSGHVSRKVKHAFHQVRPADFYSKNGRFKRPFKRMKYLPKVIKQMKSNGKDRLAKSKNSLKQLKRIRDWQGFKDKLKHSLRGPKRKITHAKKLLSSRSYRKNFVRSYQLSGSTKFSLGLSALADAASIAHQTKKWNELAEKTRKVRKEHEEYRDKLKDQIDDITAQSKEIAAEWPEIINTLKDCGQSYRSFIEKAKRYADFNDVAGLPKLPVDAASPFFSLDFNSVTRQNISKAQEYVKQFLVEGNNDLSELADQMLARKILYDKVQKMTANNESVQNIIDSLQNAYEFSLSQTIKDYGKSLKRQDVVCTISRYLKSDIMYDFYQLTPFRPQCDVSATAFTSYDNQANLLRNEQLLIDVVSRYNGNSLSTLYPMVRNAYRNSADDQLKAFGRRIRHHQVVCTVSKVYSSKLMFSYISLSPFRPDCSSVSGREFQKMKNAAKTTREASTNVDNLLSTCKKYKSCPCPKMIAAENGIAESDVINMIKSLRPKMSKYCGTTGCECIRL